jgi:hypothetical protein
MAFSGSTFTKLFDWAGDNWRNSTILASRLEAEFAGIATGLTSLASAPKVPSYTVAGLPTGAAGTLAFATNGRAYNGAGTLEGAGAGTGVLVSHNGTAWKVAGTNQTVVA